MMDQPICATRGSDHGELKMTTVNDCIDSIKDEYFYKDTNNNRRSAFY
jgi:hypothetical protein